MASKRVTRVRSTPMVVDETVVENVTTSRSGKARLILLLLLLLALLLLFWYRTNTWPVAALVNNKPVWRYHLDQQLYQQGGQQVLDSIITQRIVDDEIAKSKLTASADEVNARISEIKESLGDSFDTALAAQGLTIDELEKQVELQIKIEKLLDNQATASAEEITQLMKDGNLDASTAAKTLKQQKLQTVIQDWVDGLREKAKIVIVGKK